MLALLLVLALSAPAEPAAPYLERYFDMYPSRATEAGRHDLDTRFEDFSPERLEAWIAFNRSEEGRLASALGGNLSRDDRLDAELLLRRVRWELDELATRDRPRRDPLFWTGILGNATVFLLVRDDRPLPERLDAALARTRLLPRLCEQAHDALSTTPPELVAPELVRIAAGQARATARFYREGFPVLYSGNRAASAAEASRAAGAELERLAGFLDELAKRATGSPRLRSGYAAALEIATGEKDPDAVLTRAVKALAAKRDEAAAFGRSVWKRYFPDSEAPRDDRDLLRRLFARVSADRAKTVEEFVEDYRKQVAALDAYLHAHPIVTLPDPLTLFVDSSPGYFVGQSVGGVYAAGPYAPDAKTLWFLPTPPDSASPAEKDAFFRDFNHHFNVMITPHEILPGHYLQLKVAAHLPRKVRALFADGVYVEGWGTFSERLMLDLGWGDPLDRLAHLKKQIENIARAIVDVRVHTKEMPREEVLRFVKEDALQDEQFASNMWARAITTPTQITTYWLGYEEIRALYADARSARGAGFRLKDFMDTMLSDGGVPVAKYREKILPAKR